MLLQGYSFLFCFTNETAFYLKKIIYGVNA